MDKNENKTGLDYSEEVTSFVSMIRQNLQGPRMGERSRKETERKKAQGMAVAGALGKGWLLRHPCDIRWWGWSRLVTSHWLGLPWWSSG